METFFEFGLSTIRNFFGFLTIYEPVISLVVNTILTSLIIWQTFSLAKKQKKQDEEFNKRQEKLQIELQSRQFQLDTFKYRNDIYISLTKIGQLTAEYTEIFDKMYLKDKSCRQLHALFGTYLDVLKIESSEILAKLRQGEFFFGDNIFDSIRKVAENFNEITGDVGKLGLYPEILTEAELETAKVELLDDIEERSKIINDYMNYLHSIIPKKLQIKNID